MKSRERQDLPSGTRLLEDDDQDVQYVHYWLSRPSRSASRRLSAYDSSTPERLNMVLNEDYVDLLKAALDHSVEFLIVGATALAIHGLPRLVGSRLAEIPQREDS